MHAHFAHHHHTIHAIRAIGLLFLREKLVSYPDSYFHYHNNTRCSILDRPFSFINYRVYICHRKIRHYIHSQKRRWCAMRSIDIAVHVVFASFFGPPCREASVEYLVSVCVCLPLCRTSSPRGRRRIHSFIRQPSFGSIIFLQYCKSSRRRRRAFPKGTRGRGCEGAQ